MLLENIGNKFIIKKIKSILNKVPKNNKIRFRLSDGEFPCSYGCQSYVEIKHKIDVRLTGFRRFYYFIIIIKKNFSCCYRPKEDTVSDSNQLFVIYRPNGRTARFSLRFIQQA